MLAIGIVSHLFIKSSDFEICQTSTFITIYTGSIETVLRILKNP